MNYKQQKYVIDRAWQYFDTHNQMSREKFEEILDVAETVYIVEDDNITDKIDKSEWKTENPKLFEFDSKNNIVDIFVRQDPDCPFPFHKEDWWDQGLYLEEFIIYLNLFFKRNKLNYRVKYYED